MIKIMEGGMPIASDLSRGRNQQRMFDRRIASGYRLRNDKEMGRLLRACALAMTEEKGRVHHTTEIAGFVMANASLPFDIRQLFADQAILDA
jgi:hypothetical protein